MADSLVGVPGSKAQSRSGGERKRLSLCMEVKCEVVRDFTPVYAVDRNPCSVLFVHVHKTYQNNLIN